MFHEILGNFYFKNIIHIYLIISTHNVIFIPLSLYFHELVLQYIQYIILMEGLEYKH